MPPGVIESIDTMNERRKRNMNRTKRLTAMVLCVLLILTAVVSSACIAFNTDHDCDGHDCEICARIAEAVALLRGISLLGAMIVLLQMIRVLCRRGKVRSGCSDSVLITLVGQKVRLNN